MTKFWFKVADYAVKKHIGMHAEESPDSKQRYLAVVLGLQRRWARQSGVDFEAALRESRSY
jgi:hypothetical protein